MAKISIVAVAAFAAVLAGCASTTDPVPLGGGQYSVSSSNFWAWSGAGQQSDAMEAAKQFCAKQGKTLRVTSMKATDARAYRNVASGQVTFVCEDSEQDEPVALANGIYMLAGSSSGYQGIKARYQLIKTASQFCAKTGKKAELVSGTREAGTNYTSITGKADTGNTAENALQATSADLMFRCIKE